MLKSFIQKFFAILILAISLFSPAFAAVDYTIENQPQVIEKAVRFEQKGILKQKDNGYLYVEVSKDFIAETLPLSKPKAKLFPLDITSVKKGLVRTLALCTRMNRL